MYIDIDKQLHVHLMDMTPEEAGTLISIIRVAGLEERRVFHGIYRQLTQVPFDKLMNHENR